MGADPYWYFSKYHPDINVALQTLRQQEFEAGRYDPAMRMCKPPMYMFEFDFPPTANSPSPGAQHSSIAEAIESSDASGTGSILDIRKISNSPEFLASWAVSDDELLILFGTDKPTREMVEKYISGEEEALEIWEGSEEHLGIWRATNYDPYESFWDTIGRGESRYVILYEKTLPSEVLFVGYSID